jgi:hypothetical protein
MQFSRHQVTLYSIRKMNSKWFSGVIGKHGIGKEINVTSFIAIGDEYITQDFRLGMTMKNTFDEH